MTHSRVYWLTCILTLAIAAAASATTIVMPTDEQLIQKSPLIVRGTVVSSTPVDRGGAIWTETVLQVDETLKGTAAGEITIREIGGIIGDRITKIFGAPDYEPGERVLAFLTPTVRGDYQTVDLFVGKFGEVRTLNGQRLWRRNDAADHVTLLDHDFRPVAASNVQRDAAAFEQYVSDRAAGRKGSENYGVPNPVLERSASNLDNSSQFTMISEPTIYRWFLFDKGSAAQWYSYGSQPGYAGGGLNEIKAAMAAWTSYSAANIRYSYAGSFTTQPVGLSRPNGVNEILFNDPLGEISGTWNPSTGGVVGQGGFNGVASGGNWTPSFSADSQHTQQTYHAYEITEGNLTIQDNVSSSQGISSAVLAEIIAHEFGHTLGFGHSADNTALMYATVTGLGASLRSDDQLAARWLYGNGSAVPAPTPAPTPAPSAAPAAPSALSGSASGSSVTLQWTDNSTNETGFSVYYAAATGAFSKIGDLAAGAHNATVTGLSSGTFRFYVTAFNSSGESSASNTATVTIAGQAAPLAASFTFTPSTGTAGATAFTFTDQSTGSIVSRSWNFGDGATSTSATASHIYATAGQYTVTLTVRDSSGAQSAASQVVSVAAAQVPLSAAFSWSPSSPVAGDLMSFVDQSTGGVTSWLWNFGDGTTSSQPNPTKRYSNAGSYAVTLTVYRNAETRVAAQTISVGASIPALPATPPSFKLLVPVTAQTNGSSGSVWRTEMTLFNAGADGANVTVTTVPGAGVAPQSRSFYLGPRETRTFSNALLDLFGMGSGVAGLAVEATNPSVTPDLRVTSRTFDASGTGTFGQAVPPVASADLQQTLYLTGIIANSDYRTNIGLVNRSNAAVATTLTLLDDTGGVVNTANLNVPANSFQQGTLAAYFGANANSRPLLSLQVSTAAGDAVSAYASVVDNRTQDPVYIQALPLTSSRLITVPVVGRSAGANNTFWRSDVTIYNPGSSWTSVGLTLHAAGGPAYGSFSVGPRQSLVVNDVLNALGLSSGSGALQLTWSGNNSLVVTSRTYTTVDGGGTYGQSVDPVTAFSNLQYVPGLRSDASYRSNIGFVNGGGDAITVEATLISSTGAPVAVTSVPLAGNGQAQYALSSLFPGVNAQTLGTFTLQVRSGSPVFAYGSMVDNATGDPVFYAAK